LKLASTLLGTARIFFCQLILVPALLLILGGGSRLKAANTPTESWAIVEEPEVTPACPPYQIIKFGELIPNVTIGASVSTVKPGKIQGYVTEHGKLVPDGPPQDFYPDLSLTKWSWLLENITVAPPTATSGTWTGQICDLKFDFFAKPMETGTLTFTPSLSGTYLGITDHFTHKPVSLVYYCGVKPEYCRTILPTVGITIETSQNPDPDPNDGWPNGVPIQSGSSVVVGEPITLVVKDTLSSAGLSITYYEWDVPGISYYDAYAESYPITPIPRSDKTESNIDLFLPVIPNPEQSSPPPPSADVPISCPLMISDKTSIGLAGKIKLVAPGVVGHATMPGNGTLLNVLHLTGNSTEWGAKIYSASNPFTGPFAMTCSASDLEPVASFGYGETSWLQLVDDLFLCNLPTLGIVPDGHDVGRDNGFPYSDQMSTDDSPAWKSVFPFKFGAMRNFSAKMNFMWLSPVEGSIWVPLFSFDWGFYEHADFSLYPLPRWVLTSYTHPPTLKIDPPTAEPDWTQTTYNR
jgi:hypothetical protein